MSNWDVPTPPTTYGCLPFPTFQAAVNQVHDNSQAPQRMCLTTALSALSLASQGVIDVGTPSGRIIPTSLLILIVAKSGERKSTIEAMFLQAIRAFQAEHDKNYRIALERYERDVRIWTTKTKALEKALNKLVSDRMNCVEAEAALRQLMDEEPVVPRKIQLLYEDATPQAILWGLYADFPSAGLMSSEGGSILDGPAFADMPKLNALWSGDQLTVSRVTKGTFRIVDGRLTASIMVQPGIFDRHMDRHGGAVRDSGLYARFMVCYPASTQGTRFLKHGTKSSDHIDAFSARITEILERNLAIIRDPDFKRQVLEFSPEASARWLEFYNWVESELRPQGRFQEAGDHASKLADNVARVAALLHYFEGFEGLISLDTVNAAIQICDACSHDFTYLFVKPPQGHQDARSLDDMLNRLRQRTRYVRKNHVRRCCPHAMRSDGRFYAALDLLCSQGSVATFLDHKNAEWLDLMPHLPPPPVTTAIVAALQPIPVAPPKFPA